MNILDISIIVFCVLELANVIILYFKPGFKHGNGVAVFNQWEEGKKDEKQHMFNRYLKNWVAGAKLVFVVLLIVIMIAGSEFLKVHAIVAVIISIATYFFGLHPIIRKLDKMGEITPKGYSKTLLLMIVGFILMFTVALIVYAVA